MNKVGFFGEILVDLIQNKNGLFEPIPGGSVLNTACTFQMLGGKSVIFSTVGDDYWGNWLVEYLKSLNIEINYIRKEPSSKTSLAFAVTNENGDASYDFYKYILDKRLLFNFEDIKIFHYGSFFAILPENQKNLEVIFKERKKRNFILSYDPNIRKNFPKKLYKNILNNFRNSDIIKCSIEDLFVLYGEISIDNLFLELEKYSPALIIITLGKDGAAFKRKGGKINVVSGIYIDNIIDTIGAGDNFTAGYLYFLYKNDITNNLKLSMISDTMLIEMIKFANKLGAFTLKYKGARIIINEFKNEFKF